MLPPTPFGGLGLTRVLRKSVYWFLSETWSRKLLSHLKWTNNGSNIEHSVHSTKKCISKHFFFFWCFRLSQIGDSVSKWKDHIVPGRTMIGISFCQGEPQYFCHGPSWYYLVLPEKGAWKYFFLRVWHKTFFLVPCVSCSISVSVFFFFSLD